MVGWTNTVSHTGTARAGVTSCEQASPRPPESSRAESSATWPTTTPQYLPPNPQAEDPHPGNAHRDKPLSPPAQGLLGLLLAKYGNPEHIDPHSYGDAYEVLTRYGVGLFGQPGTTPSAPPTPIP